MCYKGVKGYSNSKRKRKIYFDLLFHLLLSRFKDSHEEIRFLELRRFLRFGNRVGKTICRDNDLLVFMVCKRLIRVAFGGNRSQEIDIETVSLRIFVNFNFCSTKIFSEINS
jgi:hypothetical protein